MGFFTRQNQKTMELSAEAREEQKQKSSECSKEIQEILNKYNCDIRIKQEIVIISK